MENLKNYGVQSLNAEEIKRIDGGWVIKVLKEVGKAIVTGVAYDIVKAVVKNGSPEMKNGYAGCKI